MQAPISVTQNLTNAECPASICQVKLAFCQAYIAILTQRRKPLEKAAIFSKLVIRFCVASTV